MSDESDGDVIFDIREGIKKNLGPAKNFRHWVSEDFVYIYI